jgi:uncharacterized membrane protein
MRFVPANLFLYFFLIVLAVGGFFLTTVWPEPKGFYSFILLAGAGGFGVAFYIFHIKRNHAQLVCPVGSDCNAVVNSRYSQFFGIRLEYLGMLYYLLVFVSYGTLLFSPHLFTETLLTALVYLSTLGFFFSIYLLFVQAFLLRQWCIWCLLSAFLSIAIFITSVVSIEGAMMLLAEVKTLVSVIHSLGFIFGMGGATAIVFLFGKCLRDLKIDENELTSIKGLSELIWFGIALALVGQIAEYVPNVALLAKSGPFVVQTMALFVATIASAVLMIIFEPVLSMIPFADTSEAKMSSPLRTLRRPLFIVLAIMLSSWYMAFALNYSSQGGASFALPTYGVVLFIGIIIALLFEQKFSKIQVS